MSRDILTNRWVLGGVGFLIVLSIACVLWYQHDIADDRKAAADAEELLRQSQIAKKTSDTDSVAEQAADASVESTTLTAEKPITDTTVTKDTEPTQNGKTDKETPTQIVEMPDVLVSPNGFGPYPEIPAEMNIPKDKVKVAWEALSENPRHELLFRVRVKLYQQGIKATGATYKQNGLIYPIIKGVRYVEFDEIEYPDGSVERYVSRSTGHPDDDFMRDAADSIVYESDIPNHLKIYTYPDGGIDPYEFLGLSKE